MVNIQGSMMNHIPEAGSNLMNAGPGSPQPDTGILRRVARNSVVVLAAKAIETLSSLFVLMLLARLFPTGRYGDFATINAIVLSFQPLINLEINTIMIREMSAQPGRENELLGGGMLLKAILVGAFVVAACCLDLVIGFTPVMRVAFYLAVIAEIFQQIVWVYNAVFMARERMEFEPLLSLICRATSVIGIGFVFLFWPRESIETTGFITVFVILAFSQGIRAVLGMMIAAGLVKSFRIRWSPRVAGELIRQSWIMGIATFCTGLSLRIDIYFLRYFKSSEAVALFHVPHMFTLQVQILAVSVVTALFPVFSRWGASGADIRKFQMAQDTCFRLMAGFGAIIATIATFFPALIIQVLAGSRYLPAVPAMMILSWCIPILFLNYLGANLLIVIKHQHFLIYGAVTSLLMNGILDYLWVPRYGITGASVATVLSYGTQLGIVLFILRKNGGSPLRIFSAICAPPAICLAGILCVHLFERAVMPLSSGFDSVIAGLFRLAAIGLMAALIWMIQPVSFRKTLLTRRMSSGQTPDRSRGNPVE